MSKRIRDEKTVRIQKTDSMRRLIFCEVYVPDIEDAHGHFMAREDVETAAHQFLASGATGNVDYNHDNEVNRGCFVVESFIVRESDPDFTIPGAWVVGIYVGDDELWKKILSGSIVGVSMEAWVTRE